MSEERERGTGSSKQALGVGSFGPDERTKKMLKQHKSVNPADPLGSLKRMGYGTKEIVPKDSGTEEKD